MGRRAVDRQVPQPPAESVISAGERRQYARPQEPPRRRLLSRVIGAALLAGVLGTVLACTTVTHLLQPADGQPQENLTPQQERPVTVVVPPSPTAWTPEPEARLNPLTGLPPTEPGLLDRVPLAIKISNFPVQGRPHSGLSYADLVFEYYIGEGMTRFLALYYGQDAPEVGPIRSGRLIDGQLVRMYGGALGMKGADPYVYDVLEERLPERVFSATPALCPALCPYTTAYTYGTFGDTAAFSQLLKAEGVDTGAPELNGMAFQFDPPPGGEPIQELWLEYNYLNQVGWNYDPQLGSFLRSQDKADATLAPMPDKVTGEQLAFENVVVLFAGHEFESPTLIEVEVWDAQDERGYVFRDGRMYPVRWSVPSMNSPIRFEREGEAFALKPGATWMEIFTIESDAERLEEGRWHVRFRR